MFKESQCSVVERLWASGTVQIRWPVCLGSLQDGEHTTYPVRPQTFSEVYRALPAAPGQHRQSENVSSVLRTYLHPEPAGSLLLTLEYIQHSFRVRMEGGEERQNGTAELYPIHLSSWRQPRNPTGKRRELEIIKTHQMGGTELCTEKSKNQ